MTDPEELRGQLLTAIRGAWSTRPTCWDQQVDAAMAVRDEGLEQLQAERDALAAQMAAIRTLITEDYGYNYNDEDVVAAVERLMRHLSEHEANVQRIAQSKNEALERAQAERDALKAELDEARAAIERVRADCDAMTAGDGIADDNPAIWVSGAQAHAKRVLAILDDATAAGGGPGPAAKAFMAWIEEVGYRAALDAPQRPEDTREETGSG